MKIEIILGNTGYGKWPFVVFVLLFFVRVCGAIVAMEVIASPCNVSVHLNGCLTQCGSNESEWRGKEKKKTQQKSQNLGGIKIKEQRETVAAVTIAKAAGDWAILMEELGKNEDN